MNSTLLTIFTGFVAVAIVLQSLVLYAFYQAAKTSSARLHDRLERLEQKTDPILTVAHAILDDAQPKISEITTNLAEATAIVRANVLQVADTTSEIVERARMQAVRLDELVSSTLEKVEQTTDFLQNRVVAPVRRVHAIVQAVGAGLSFLKSTRRQKQASHQNGEDEEEMFI